MTQRTVTRCNECNIAKETASYLSTQAWLVLKNMDLLTSINDKVRLDTDHHFCIFKCLRKWSLKAETESPRLVKAAEGLQPRGTFSNDELGLQY